MYTKYIIISYRVLCFVALGVAWGWIVPILIILFLALCEELVPSSQKRAIRRIARAVDMVYYVASTIAVYLVWGLLAGVIAVAVFAIVYEALLSPEMPN